MTEENSSALPTIDQDRQENAKEYARISRRLLLVDLVFGFIYLLSWMLFGWSVNIKHYILSFTTNPFLLVAGYAFVFGGIFFVINSPLSYYEGFYLPHKFKQSNQTISSWISDQIKGILVNILLGGLILEIIYIVLRATPTYWWLWASGIMLLINVILANLAPIILMPIFYKFIPLGEEHDSLKEKLMQIANHSGTKVQGVYKFDLSKRTKSANAALTGLGNTRRIILGDTLLNEFTEDEIETVMAHELGHHINHDIPLIIIFDSIITLASFYLASLGLAWGVNYFGLENTADIAGLPLFGLAIALFGIITMPLSNSLSRWRERKADQYALSITGNGKAYASALTRLVNQNLAELDPEPWVEFCLHSHPSLQKRIAMAHASLEKPENKEK